MLDNGIWMLNSAGRASFLVVVVLWVIKLKKLYGQQNKEDKSTDKTNLGARELEPSICYFERDQNIFEQGALGDP